MDIDGLFYYLILFFFSSRFNKRREMFVCNYNNVIAVLLQIDICVLSSDKNINKHTMINF